MTNSQPEQGLTLPVNGSGSSIAHLRHVALSFFENERLTTPDTSGSFPWSVVVKLHSNRFVREGKSGPMVGGYGLAGTRNNPNVAARSIIHLDIDSEGEKDKQSGRMIKVCRSAPLLDAIRSNIAKFEWIANSTHWHEPGIGAIKYRVTILPDRDFLPDEHDPLLEALDELLGGCLDRAAWPWSQAFYLPSCPSHASRDAFVVHNPGIPVPVDNFVARGRQILAARQQLPAQPVPSANRVQSQLPEAPANIAVVRAMLATIPASIDRATWVRIVMAVRSLAWACGEQLVRDWSQTCPAKWSPQDFASAWSSYDPTRPDAVGFGTLDYVARLHGYAGSVATKPQSDGKGADVANGRLFAEQNRNKLLHIHETGEWLQFHPSAGWLRAEPREEERAAKAIVEHLRADAARQLAAGVEEDKVRKLLRHIENSSRAQNLRSMIDMSKSEPGMTKRASEFDADPMLLGLANGVLDLRTGQLRAPSPDLLVSKRCNVAFDPTACCAGFELFMAEVQPDLVTRQFLQRLAGNWLTGDTSMQAFACLFGTGANGKSVFIELLAWLLGDYSKKIATEMLMQHKRNPQGPSPDIVSLKGVRLAYASETEEGQRFAAARIKELTGGDTLSGRVPYGKADVCFYPTHKLVIVGNHKPDISDMSHGMWRRIMLVGFEQTIPEASRDPALLDKLKSEGPGILNWALAGLQAWRHSGRQTPKSVQDATATYREDQDILGEWLSERCDTGATLTADKKKVYLDYQHWAKASGHEPMSQTRLTRRLNDRGLKIQRDKRTVAGLALKFSHPFEPVL